MSTHRTRGRLTFASIGQDARIPQCVLDIQKHGHCAVELRPEALSPQHRTDKSV